MAQQNRRGGRVVLAAISPPVRRRAGARTPRAPPAHPLGTPRPIGEQRAQPPAQGLVEMSEGLTAPG